MPRGVQSVQIVAAEFKRSKLGKKMTVPTSLYVVGNVLYKSAIISVIQPDSATAVSPAKDIAFSRK